jgi:MFS transporter, DHA1 family, inner membrane transport protein
MVSGKDQRSTVRAVAAALALATAAFTYGTTENLPVGLLGLMADDLDASLSKVGLLVTGYGLTVAVVSVPLTKLTARVPRRHLLSGLLAVFVVATIVSATAGNYWVLLGSRLVTALSQAVFWPVAVVAAAALFSPKARGRAASLVFTGGSLAVLAGVPFGTWVGQQTSWRAAFLLLAGIGFAALVTVAVLLPTSDPADSHAATGSAPNARSYWVLVVFVALSVGGVFTFFTYITAFATEISGFAKGTLSLLLLANGIADVCGMAIAAALIDRGPRRMLLVAGPCQVVALAGLFLCGASPVATVVFVMMFGLMLAALVTAFQARVMEVAPGSTDIASAGTSAAFNVGIGGGALIGGLTLDVFGARATAPAGALLAAGAVATLLAEPYIARRGEPQGPAAAGLSPPVRLPDAKEPRR